MNDEKAGAIMDFCRMIVGAVNSGFADHQMTIVDLYQAARNHVKSEYDFDTAPLVDIVGQEFIDEYSDHRLACENAKLHEVIGNLRRHAMDAGNDMEIPISIWDIAMDELSTFGA